MVRHCKYFLKEHPKRKKYRLSYNKYRVKVHEIKIKRQQKAAFVISANHVLTK